MATRSKSTLHIRCGQDIEQALQEAGMEGDFLDFSDPYCQGPVRGIAHADFLVERSAFIASAYGIDPAEVTARQSRRYEALRHAHDYDTITLWFEHDHFDQLILAHVLNHFADLSSLPEIDLVCVDDYPVLPRFTGLGQLGPSDLKAVWEKRVRVTQDHIRLGKEVWCALTMATPNMLATIAHAGTPAVPPMAGAIDRHLDELPSSRHGLGLTETLSLRILAEKGVISAGAMFSQLMLRYETRPYLGDLMYWHELDRLVRGGAAEVVTAGKTYAQNMLRLTELGERILTAGEDWLDYMPEPRFVGGVEIAPSKPHWRRFPKGNIKLVE
ncbi:DUF1835 domain-containing protein [Kordiimonas sp.]|uniref:DUF1835 domain-containing protein n=1 Tax=Kordiimonas sp. TaxID=1970157 RepID=UPI003A8DCCCE